MSTTAKSTKNVLNTDIEIRGSLKCSGDVFFDGRLDGDLTTEGDLELGDNAVVRGNLHASHVLARGKINGNIAAMDKLEIKAQTELVGDIRAAKLVIDDGVQFVGKADISPSPGKKTVPASPSPVHMSKPPDAYKATESTGKPGAR